MKGFINEYRIDVPPCGTCKHKNKMVDEAPCDKCIDYVDKDLYIVLLGKTNIILKEKLKWMKK